MLCVYKPVIIMDPSTGQKNSSSSVSALLNIAGVDANLQALKTPSEWLCNTVH